jgi:hypothetical protein
VAECISPIPENENGCFNLTNSIIQANIGKKKLKKIESGAGFIV